MSRALRFFLRSAANSTPLPSLRHRLWRWSGVEVGKNTFINLRLTVVDNYRGGVIKIGDQVAIAPGVSLIADSDPNASYLVIVPEFTVRGSVIIEDHAWIGVGAIILPNVRVGRYSIVGAGAVVTKDVPDYMIVSGVPAVVRGDVREREGWQ